MNSFQGDIDTTLNTKKQFDLEKDTALQLPEHFRQYVVLLAALRLAPQKKQEIVTDLTLRASQMKARIRGLDGQKDDPHFSKLMVLNRWGFNGGGRLPQGFRTGEWDGWIR